MSTEENSNNIETIPLLNANIKEVNIKTNPESSKDQNQLIITHEQKIKQLKQKLKALLQKTLGKSLLNLETNNQSQLQILNTTTKSYKEFDNKINLMKNQVEENIKKKEDNKKMKKIKASKNKIRSRTSQKSNNLKTLDLNSNNQSKIKDSNKNINNESNKSLVKIRAKTEGKNNSRILNSEKKSVKNKNNISIKVENSKLNNTLKLNKTHSSKFTLSEQSYNKTKKKLNLDHNNNNDENNNTKIKERKNSKDNKNIVKKNSSKTKINTLQKSQNNLKSKSNLFTNSKEKLNEEKIISKKLLSNKNNTPKIDYRKSFDYSNKKIPKPKMNNYVKKNTEIFSEKKSSSKKKFLNNKKSKNNINNNKKEENIKQEEDTDEIIKRYEKQKEILERIRKQREENNLRDEEKKKEIEKENEEEKKREEERKKRDIEIKRREEQRKKELEEEERKRDEERKKKQMEIEAKIEKEKIEKENMKKEMELEKKKEIERQKKLEEEIIKKEEMEKLELEMDKLKLKEEEVKELPNDIELNLEKNEGNEIVNKNKEMDIQDLLELEEKNAQNFEYFHIKEVIEKDSLLVTPEEKKKNKEEIKNDINIDNNINNDNNDLNKNIVNNLEEKLYRNISILELIHDVPKFSPVLFEFLSFEDTLEFTSISKKIKRQRIYIFNLQKTNIIKNIGLNNEQNLEKKIKEYEENYSTNELNEPYIEFHLSSGAARAIQLLNNNNYSKIFRRPVLDSNLSSIYIAYRILFIFLKEVDIAKIPDDKLFWVKCTEYLNSKSENGKIGDFILNKFENYNCDCKTIYYIEQIMKGKKDNISPSYFSKICGSTGLLIFLIKELMEYCGVIISTKKTQLSRIYNNLKFFKNIVDTLSEFNKTLENFNQ